jgi:hypothetical protein
MDLHRPLTVWSDWFHSMGVFNSTKNIMQASKQIMIWNLITPAWRLLIGFLNYARGPLNGIWLHTLYQIFGGWLAIVKLTKIGREIRGCWETLLASPKLFWMVSNFFSHEFGLRRPSPSSDWLHLFRSLVTDFPFSTKVIQWYYFAITFHNDNSRPLLQEGSKPYPFRSADICSSRCMTKVFVPAAFAGLHVH